MQEIEIVARRLAAEPSVRNLFLTGPSGSGKRSVANLMNAVRHGDASLAGVEVFQCLPGENDLDRLTGRTKPVFRKPPVFDAGAMQRAAGGTLYIAEIESTVLSQQKLLLRILKESSLRSLRPPSEADVSLTIWSVEKTLDQTRAAVAAGAFDEGLWNALSELDSIHIPLLRDRVPEIRILAERFIRTSSRPGLKVASEAWDLLTNHTWPRNTGELKQVIARAVSRCCADTLGLSDFADLAEIVTSQRDERRKEGWQTKQPQAWTEEEAGSYFWALLAALKRARVVYKREECESSALRQSDPCFAVIPEEIFTENVFQLFNRPDGNKSRDMVGPLFGRMDVPGPHSYPTLKKRLIKYRPRA